MTHSQYLLFSLIVGCGLPMSLAAFGYFLRFLPINRFTFKIPNRDYWLAPERRNEMFNYLFRHCLWLACLMAIFMVGIQLLVIQANHQTPPHLSIPLTLAAAGGFLAAKAVWIGTLFCHFKKVAN
jgi:hypothetical protein